MSEMIGTMIKGRGAKRKKGKRKGRAQVGGCGEVTEGFKKGICGPEPGRGHVWPPEGYSTATGVVLVLVLVLVGWS
jgi:hypothetical protein